GVNRYVLSFFFSSRRRHTRSKRDWSSDVCSSDLRGGHQPHQQAVDAADLGPGRGGRGELGVHVDREGGAGGDPLAVAHVVVDRGGAAGEAVLGGEGPRDGGAQGEHGRTGDQQTLAAAVLELGEVGRLERADLRALGLQRLRAAAGGVVAQHVHGDRGLRGGASLVVSGRGGDRREDRLHGGADGVVAVDA